MIAELVEFLKGLLKNILILLGLETIAVEDNTKSLKIFDIPLETDQPIPRSVNYHFTRQCNYSCGFCFHTAKTSYLLDLENVKVGLRMLKKAGMTIAFGFYLDCL